MMFTYRNARLKGTNRTILLIGVGHPSKYAARTEWLDVIERTRSILPFSGAQLPLISRLPDLAN